MQKRTIIIAAALTATLALAGAGVYYYATHHVPSECRAYWTSTNGSRWDREPNETSTPAFRRCADEPCPASTEAGGNACLTAQWARDSCFRNHWTWNDTGWYCTKVAPS